MKNWMLTAALVGAALCGFTAEQAHAGTLTATIKDGYASAGDKLTGSWTATITGETGSNTASLTGSFKVSGGNYASWFGGVGAVVPISATLTNFESNVTGTTGINTQAGYGGDIFAEAGDYAPAPSSWNPDEFIMFDYGSLLITGNNGAKAEFGLGTTGMDPVGKIYNYNGKTRVNFWANRTTFTSSSGWTKVVSHGDWIPVVTSSGTTGDPVPEPSTYAMAFLGLLGFGGWMRRKRKLAVSADDQQA